MMKKIILNVLLILINSFYVLGQQAKTISNDTILGKFQGKQSYSYTIADSAQIKNGKYSFVSNLYKEYKNDTFELSELKIQGNYINNQMDGDWRIQYGNIFINDIGVKRSWNANLNYSLNGIDYEYLIRYKNGHYNGKSTLNKKKIVNGRYIANETGVTVFFENDTIKGSFLIFMDNGSIKGITNSDGFFDGKLEIKYQLDSITIIETRTYDNGFLIDLEKRNVKSNQLLSKIEFSDVVDRLQVLKSTAHPINYKISDEWFGIKFNLGYQDLDSRITSQDDANNFMLKSFHLFDSIRNFQVTNDSLFTILKLTRRFQFLYSSEEDSIVESLIPYVQSLQNKVESITKRPTVILRKNNSDTLHNDYQTLIHINNKLDIINDVLNKISNNYFDYRFRDKFYEEGVSGLNKPDTISFDFNGKFYSTPYQIDNNIKNSDSLLLKLHNYAQITEKLIIEKVNSINKSLTVYDNQDKIDSLDRIISDAESMLPVVYQDIEIYKSEESSKIPYSYKVYSSLEQRILKDFKTKYLNNSIPQEEMIVLGNSIACIYTFIVQSKEQLDLIGNMKKTWNDSLFTIYRDNPFYFRKLESKTLEGIQNASNILFTHYATLLINAKTCNQLHTEMQNIFKLNERVKYLIANQENENVQQLDKALRRERVPNRIERILEL
jgi:hypothetical protein